MKWSKLAERAERVPRILGKIGAAATYVSLGTLLSTATKGSYLQL